MKTLLQLIYKWILPDKVFRLILDLGMWLWRAECRVEIWAPDFVVEVPVA